MKNILSLCDIFHCKINNLVHNNLTDIDSLDEEIIMNVVKFNEKKQNQVKSLSNVICLIGKIGGIVLKVAIPFIILAMILIPFIVNNVDISENKITFKTENIKAIDDKLELFDIIVFDLDEDISSEEVISIFEKNSRYEIIGYLEAGCLCLVVELIVMIIILKYVENLFDNIKNNNTPFTLDNVNYIKRISYLMIALIMVNPLAETFFSLIYNVSGNTGGFELMSILEILIIFSMSYIFEYGYEIQKDSKGKMYGKDNEQNI